MDVEKVGLHGDLSGPQRFSGFTECRRDSIPVFEFMLIPGSVPVCLESPPPIPKDMSGRV